MTLITEPSLSSISLSSNGFPRHAFLASSRKSKITLRNERNRGFKHSGNNEQSSVLACGFRDVRDAIVVRIVVGRRVTVYRSGLVEIACKVPVLSSSCPTGALVIATVLNTSRSAMSFLGSENRTLQGLSSEVTSTIISFVRHVRRVHRSSPSKRVSSPTTQLQ